MGFIRSGRISGSPVRALSEHRYFTKPWLQRYPAPGDYQPCFQELFCPPLHVILLLCPPDFPCLCAPRFRSSSQRSCCSGDVAPLPPLHALPFTERAVPARQKPRYLRSNFTTKTAQCHLQREGGLLEQNARRFKPIRHLPDANPMVERERL